MDAARFVAEFIGPNMTWQRAWTDLYQGGGILAPDSPLIERVEQRLTWQTYAEFTYAGNRGRTSRSREWRRWHPPQKISRPPPEASS